MERDRQKSRQYKHQHEESVRAERWMQIRSVCGYLFRDGLFYTFSCLTFGAFGFIGGINFPQAIACDRPDTICALVRWHKDSLVLPKIDEKPGKQN